MKNTLKGKTECFTPQHYLDLLKFHIEDLQLSGINRILEPACGDGALVTLARNLFTGASIDAIDLNDHGFNIVADFVTWNEELGSEEKPYDLVLMNPPYIPVKKNKYLTQMKKYGVSGKNNLYDLFILKAMAHLKDGGILVALLPSNAVRRDSVPFIHKFKTLAIIESFTKFKGVGITQYTIIILQKTPMDSIEPAGYFDYDKHRVIDYCVIRNEHYNLMYDMRFSQNGWVKLKDVCDCDDRNYGPYIINPTEQNDYYAKHPQYQPKLEEKC
jgi:type I restriction-modification system DNA methylase subunit